MNALHTATSSLEPVSDAADSAVAMPLSNWDVRPLREISQLDRQALGVMLLTVVNPCLMVASVVLLRCVLLTVRAGSLEWFGISGLSLLAVVICQGWLETCLHRWSDQLRLRQARRWFDQLTVKLTAAEVSGQARFQAAHRGARQVATLSASAGVCAMLPADLLVALALCVIAALIDLHVACVGMLLFAMAWLVVPAHRRARRTATADAKPAEKTDRVGQQAIWARHVWKPAGVVLMAVSGLRAMASHVSLIEMLALLVLVSASSNSILRLLLLRRDFASFREAGRELERLTHPRRSPRAPCTKHEPSRQRDGVSTPRPA
ncbi:MAG: hypothetical protein KDB14_24225 [Planctomycetales bacterium]|nr:hypothetical protein [Planctomycetales bacterium]